MALDRYRARHGIPDGEHLQMLEGFGWSAEEFRCGMKKLAQHQIRLNSTPDFVVSQTL